MTKQEKDGCGGGTNGSEGITQVQLRPGREMTLEEEKRFLTMVFAEAIGHDGWLVPHLGREAKGGRESD